MGLLSALFGPAKRPSVAMPVHVRAKFDSAEKGDDYRHWANADAFSADAAGSALCDAHYATEPATREQTTRT